MSTAGAPGAAADTQRYFCHQCDRTVTVTPCPDGEISCSICHGGFVEEFDAPNPNPRLSPHPNPNPNAFPFAFPAPASDPFFPAPSPFAFLIPPPAVSFDIRSPGDLSGLFGPDPSTPIVPPSAGPEPFNPFAFIQNHLQGLTAGGATIQFVVEGGGGGLLPASLGNYFFGPGLEQLIQQLAENDPNRYGTPPASKSAVESLPDIKISQDLLASDEAQCAVCKDAFEVGAEAKQMPCKHIYHKDCILPWLALHNSCPVCRYELPTDDPDYESQARGEHTPVGQVATGTTYSAGAGGAAAAGAAGAPGSRMGLVERRFRISLPSSFRAPGPHAGASNTGDSGNDGGSRREGSDTNSGGR